MNFGRPESANAVKGSPGGVLKLDLGCGASKRQGFLGVDRRKFEGVDAVTDLSKSRWLFTDAMLGGHRLERAVLDGVEGFILPDSSVSEVHCSQFLEHLEHNQRQPERVRFMNELWRVMMPGCVANIITPHWASQRAYGDFTHADKPVSEMFYNYLDVEWRRVHALDNDAAYNPDGYSCDFTSKITHSLHPLWEGKSHDEIMFALAWNKEAAIDLYAELTARKPF